MRRRRRCRRRRCRRRRRRSLKSRKEKQFNIDSNISSNVSEKSVQKSHDVDLEVALQSRDVELGPKLSDSLERLLTRFGHSHRNMSSSRAYRKHLWASHSLYFYG